MPRAKIDGSSIYYSIQSSGKPVLFVHGSGCNSSLWDDQVSALSNNFCTISIDLNGHGQSPLRDGDALQTYAQDVLGVIETLAEPCALVGHSLGSAIVQTVALAKPKKLGALVLLGAGAKLRVHPQLLETIESDFPKAIEMILNWSFHPSVKAELLQRARAQMIRNGQAMLSRDFRACDGFNVMNRLGEITLPTLLLCGQQDQLTPVKYSEFLKNQIAQSEFHIIENAGHRVMEEAAETLNDLLHRFCSKWL